MSSFFISFAVTAATKVISKSNVGGVLGGTLATFVLNRSKENNVAGMVGTGAGVVAGLFLDTLQVPKKVVLEEKIIQAPETQEQTEEKEIIVPDNTILGGDIDPVVTVPQAKENLVQDILEPPAISKVTRLLGSSVIEIPTGFAVVEVDRINRVIVNNIFVDSVDNEIDFNTIAGAFIFISPLANRDVSTKVILDISGRNVPFETFIDGNI